MKRLSTLLVVGFLSLFAFSLSLWQTPQNWQNIASFKTFLDLCLIDNQLLTSLENLEEVTTLVMPLTKPLTQSELNLLDGFCQKGGHLLLYPLNNSLPITTAIDNFFQVEAKVLTYSIGSFSYTKLSPQIVYLHSDITPRLPEDNTKELLLQIISEFEPESLTKTREFGQKRVTEITAVILNTLEQKKPTKDTQHEIAAKLESILIQAGETAKKGHIWKLNALKKEAEELSELYKATFFASYPVETRGIWISTKALPRTREGIALMVANIAQAGFNVILPEVFAHGYTIYPSKVAQKYGIVKQDPTFINFNPLPILIEEAKKNDLEIHAWFSVFYVGLNSLEPILSLYPSWAAVNQDGTYGYSRDGNHLYFASPLNCEFREYVTDLMVEVAVEGVSGIHLDYVRYAGPDVKETDYSEVAVSDFSKRFGLLPNQKRTPASKLWIYFRAGGVDELVKLASQKIKSYNPQIILSSAVAPDGPPTDYNRNYMQNWPLWLQRGYLDFVIPMTYSPNPQNVTGWFNSAVAKAPPFAPAYAGLSAFGLFDKVTLNKQVSELGRSSGSLGSFFFAYDHLDLQDLKVLKAGVFSEKAIPAHHFFPENYSKLVNHVWEQITQPSLELPPEILTAFLSLSADGQSLKSFARYKQTLEELEILKGLTSKLVAGDLKNTLTNYLSLLKRWLLAAGRNGLVNKSEIEQEVFKVTRQLGLIAPDSPYFLIPNYLKDKIWGPDFYTEANNLLNLYKDDSWWGKPELYELLNELLFLTALNWY